jgi:hypothetical protein
LQSHAYHEVSNGHDHHERHHGDAYDLFDRHHLRLTHRLEFHERFRE